MRRTVFNGKRGIALDHQSVDQAGSETVAAADPVDNLPAVALRRLVELSALPDDRAPVVDGRGLHLTQRRGDSLEVRIRLDDLFDHPLEALGVELAEVRIGALDLESEAGGEILLVSDHHVNIFGDLLVDLLRALLPADRLPEGRTVVEVVARDRAVFLRRLERLDHNLRRRIRERRENAAGMEPARPEFTEDVIKINIAFFQLGNRRVAAVRTADRAADAVAAFGEVESVPDRAPDSVIWNPADQRGVDAALHDEILDETPHRIVGKRRDHPRAETEASAQAARHVVFTAALPRRERARRVDSSGARIETEHDFTEGENVVLAFVGRFDFHFFYPFQKLNLKNITI